MTDLERTIFSLIGKDKKWTNKQKWESQKIILNNERTAVDIIINDFKLDYISLVNDFKLDYISLVIKQHGIGTEKRHADQWNRNANLNMNPFTYGNIFFWIEELEIHTWKRLHLQKMVLDEIYGLMKNNPNIIILIPLYKTQL